MAEVFGIRYKNVIISPHIDDAFFSLGGMMLNYAKSRQKVIDVFSVSDFVKKPASYKSRLGAQAVTKMRKSEEEANSARTGATVEYLDFLDSPIRTAPNGKRLERAIARKLLASISNAENVFVPMAIGGHEDHELVSKAAISAFSKIRGNIYFYEDLPYAAKYSVSSSYAMRKLKLAKTSKPKKIAIPLLKKVRLCLSYRSQITPVMMMAIVAYSIAAGGLSGACERVWPISQHKSIGVELRRQ